MPVVFPYFTLYHSNRSFHRLPKFILFFNNLIVGSKGKTRNLYLGASLLDQNEIYEIQIKYECVFV